MFAAANVPPEIMASILGPPLPRIRAAELPGVVSVRVNHLFPDVPEEIYLRGDDYSAVRRSAEQSLADVDMTMIKPEDSVNLLCSEHGFCILGGEPYAEMLRTIKDVIQKRTGCENIRLTFCLIVMSNSVLTHR